MGNVTFINKKRAMIDSPIGVTIDSQPLITVPAGASFDMEISEGAHLIRAIGYGIADAQIDVKPNMKYDITCAFPYLSDTIKLTIKESHMNMKWKQQDR